VISSGLPARPMGRCVALGVRLLISVHSVAGDLRIDQAGIHRTSWRVVAGSCFRFAVPSGHYVKLIMTSA
jgi:hypothetical protein